MSIVLGWLWIWLTNLEGTRLIPVKADLSEVKLFAMDKEHTMRTPKAQLYEAQPLVRGTIVWNTPQPA